MTSRVVMAGVATLLHLTFSANVLAQVDCSQPDNRFGISQGSAFTITTAGFTETEINTAIGYWSDCPAYGSEIPAFQLGGSGGIPVTITKMAGNSQALDGSCGESSLQPSNGQITSAAITVWTKESDGDTCEPLTDTIAHELGHLLGLTDNGQTSCNGHIMGRRDSGGTRSVEDDDCAVADDKWETSSESAPDPDPWCDAFCWTSCVNNTCPGEHPGCPILIDMENDGIHLTGLDDPVWFDVDADGDTDLMSWTDRSEGLLALDRNGNGRIDDGSELFGNATRLINGALALNGYLALAELDSWVFAGNGDGRIDAADGAYEHLRLWTDRNHDGISQPTELVTLPSARILRIGLDYRRSNRTDRHGNEFRFLGTGWKEVHKGLMRPILTWDVFFLVVP
ncbi:MAG TPA: hypothetical protein VN493_13940 [Thermoanaerobaculia bacterium]|nr:hypothetical protein [Thermoanaerobaculia bacterium]